VIHVDDLHKTYPGSRKQPAVEAVRGITFEVPRGQVFGLLGPNGAGKSTTLGCITTLVRPSRGRITIDDIDLAKDPIAVRRRLAVVPQVRNLDRDLTIRELLLFHGSYFGMPKAEREARAAELLAILQLEDKANTKPATLSGGLQQRALIARALMHHPTVLLLDEPTVGLDPQTRRLLWDLLARLRDQGLTMILTTHYMEEADALCERVAIIDHGRILASGTPAELKHSLPGAHVIDLAARYPPAPSAPATAGADGAAGGGSLRDALAQIAGVVKVDQPALEAARAAAPAGEARRERLRLFVDPRDGLLDQVLAAVRAARGELEHVNLSPPSLEDVYIHLTGKDRLA
jgi:ABC-2 type transport system ATP-binding protein